MISARCAPVHYPDARIDVGVVSVDDRHAGFYEIRIRGKGDAVCDGLVVFLSKRQCESIRDQILALFPLEPALGHPLNVPDTLAAARDYRDFPGSIAPSLMAGEGGAP